MTTVLYAGHSLVAERQQIWGAELRKQLHAEGINLLEAYPLDWGVNHHREGGWPVANAGSHTHWAFHPAFWSWLERVRPDAVLLQQEAYCTISQEFADWCERTGAKLITFSWENMAQADDRAKHVLERAAYTLFGNTDAQKIAHATGIRRPSAILPQVGLDPEIFKPDPSAPQAHNTVAFFGRDDVMKGQAVLEKAAEGRPWKVFTKHKTGAWYPYYELAKRFQAATIMAVPSIDVPGIPREQFAPAITVESCLSGLPVVTSDQSAIMEWTRDAPSVLHTPQGDWAALRETIERLLYWAKENPQTWGELKVNGREWAMRFSKENVGREYVGIIRKVIA